MSDTLRERLDALSYQLECTGRKAMADAVLDAIAELDRLEAEVKKPKLPPGWSVKIRDGTICIKSDDGKLMTISEKTQAQVIYRLLSAFLTTPDVVPSTEPVQAAGDAKQYGIFGNHTDRLTDYHVEVSLINSLVNEHLRHGLHDRDQLLARIDRAWLNVVQPEWVEVKNRLREIHSALIAPAETSDQGQDQSAPMNTETAEKPKPVSLVEKFSRERIGGNIDYWAKNTFGSPSHDQEAREIILWLLRTLDQERGV